MKDDEEIAQLSQRWAERWRAKDAASLAALYWPDATFLTATGTRVEGRAAIQRLFENTFAVYASVVSVSARRVEVSGALGYASGEYTEECTGERPRSVGTGNYVIVCRREGELWLIVEHVWTFAPATPADAQEGA